VSRALAITLVALAACSRGEAPTANANATPSATPTPNATPSANANASASATPSAPAPSTWSGHYTASVGTLASPDRYFTGEDASVGLGDGALTVTLDDHGRATGTLDGPLGTSKLDGALRANDFGAALVPDDLAHGFTGTAVGTRDGDHIAGTMRLALPLGNVVRQASFTLDRKP